LKTKYIEIARVIGNQEIQIIPTPMSMWI